MLNIYFIVSDTSTNGNPCWVQVKITVSLVCVGRKNIVWKKYKEIKNEKYISDYWNIKIWDTENTKYQTNNKTKFSVKLLTMLYTSKRCLATQKTKEGKIRKIFILWYDNTEGKWSLLGVISLTKALWLLLHHQQCAYFHLYLGDFSFFKKNS